MYHDTPMGTVLLTRDAETLTGLYWTVFRRTPQPHPGWTHDERAFDDVLGQLDEYYAGRRQTFSVPYRLGGTEFQAAVWRELEKIPYGVASSYQAVAAAIGKPGAVRAVGTAIGSNPISIVVPCHRVLTTDGRAGGYAGGIPAKLRLLRTEGIAVR